MTYHLRRGMMRSRMSFQDKKTLISTNTPVIAQSHNQSLPKASAILQIATNTAQTSQRTHHADCAHPKKLSASQRIQAPMTLMITRLRRWPSNSA